MNELVFLQKEEAVTTSLVVAEKFHKRHDRVLRAIESLTDSLPKNGAVKFYESKYKDQKGEYRKMYYLNRDAFALLVMGFTGKKALQWKLEYIKAFNQMEKLLTEKSTQAWIETRKQGKLTRKSETDVIKELVEYAKGQGSTHSDMLYVTYTKLANSSVGITNRNVATITQLNNLSIFENLILQMIRSGIDAGLGYKDIYKECKARCAAAKEIAMIG